MVIVVSVEAMIHEHVTPSPHTGQCKHEGKTYENGDVVEFYGGCSKKYVL